MKSENLNLECKPCAKCGKVPRIVSGFLGGYYAVCIGHAETRVVKTREEAVGLWNRDEYDSTVQPPRPDHGAAESASA